MIDMTNKWEVLSGQHNLCQDPYVFMVTWIAHMYFLDMQVCNSDGDVCEEISLGSYDSRENAKQAAEKLLEHLKND